MRTWLALLCVVGLSSVAGCDAREEEVGAGPVQDVGEAGAGPIEEREVTEEPGLGQEDAVGREPASVISAEQCTGLEEGGILEEEQALYQQCRDAGFLE